MINPIDWLLGLFSLDIGIDLGTANTLVHVKNRGIVIDEPSVVAIDRRSRRRNRVKAIGTDAREMVGRTPAHIVAIRPLQDGVISDFDVTEQMIHHFIGKVHGSRALGTARPRVVIGIPSGVTEVEKRAVRDAAMSAGAREAGLVDVTEVEKRAVRDAAMSAGAREAGLVEEPMAAAIGAGLPVTESVGSMIIDIGGGTTEVAVISLGGIVVSRSIRTAGDEMNEDIMNYARQKYNLLIGERMAERSKIEIGSAYPMERERTMILRGRNLVTGLPEAVEVSSVEVREALSGSVQVVIDAVKSTLDETPPELVADLMEYGIVLAGGGALLQGLAQRLQDETRMHVYVADNPLTAVVMGTGMILEKPEFYRETLTSMQRKSTIH